MVYSIVFIKCIYSECLPLFECVCLLSTCAVHSSLRACAKATEKNKLWREHNSLQINPHRNCVTTNQITFYWTSLTSNNSSLVFV